MGERALRIAVAIFEAGFEYIGYFTARVMVPFVTLGWCKVAVPENIHEIWGPSRGAGLHPGTAATLGILLWLAVAVAAALVFARG